MLIVRQEFNAEEVCSHGSQHSESQWRFRSDIPKPLPARRCIGEFHTNLKESDNILT